MPWVPVASIAIGGFEAAGFSDDSDYLLVVTSSGRGVFSTRTGEKVARDSNYDGSWYDLSALTCLGIGPLEGESLHVAGIHGGGLPTVAQDGWSASLLCPNWPEGFVVLCEPGESVWDEKRISSLVRLAPTHGDDDVACYGFSPCGNRLVIATSSTIDLFSRER